MTWTWSGILDFANSSSSTTIAELEPSISNLMIEQLSLWELHCNPCAYRGKAVGLHSESRLFFVDNHLCCVHTLTAENGEGDGTTQQWGCFLNGMIRDKSVVN